MRNEADRKEILNTHVELIAQEQKLKLQKSIYLICRLRRFHRGLNADCNRA